ncbi:hypothetical protein B0H15DRAFT_815885 [Mycena belliarum]|uniref:DUF6593 domain-containing protein n=1 Tax=Mycena belliarum TaxID=1033014 RepID=A0AAD6UF64_9AGAR|nr:hypothetical protein B0H15DRAFT_815885 [Mycena belliae]
MGIPVPIALRDSASPSPSPLPSPPHSRRRRAPPELLALNFVCTRNTRSVLNCAVLGADTEPYFHVVTRPGRTILRTNTGRAVAAVEWDPQGVYVQLHAQDSDKEKALERHRVGSWLGISRDASYRVMVVHGEPYVWIPRSESICLYHWAAKTSSDIPELIAKIERGPDDEGATLEIVGSAVERGLLETCVVCVVLFQSGCCID